MDLTSQSVLLGAASGKRSYDYWMATLAGADGIYASGLGLDPQNNPVIFGRADIGATSKWFSADISSKSGMLGSTYFGTSSGSWYFDTSYIDASGNRYLTGSSSSGSTVIKTSAANAIAWQLESLASAAVATDSSGNVYVVGGLYSGNYNNAVVTKFNSSGTVLWQRTFYRSGNYYDYATNAAVASSGNLYVLAQGNNTSNKYVTYIVKYNSSGVLQWIKSLNDTYNDIYPGGITIDADENIYVNGLWSDIGGYQVGYLAKITAAGSLSWQRRINNGTANSRIDGVSVLGSDVYVSGWASGAGNLLFKYNSSGTLQFSRQISPQFSPNFSRVFASSDGGVYLAGNSFVAKVPNDGSRTGAYTVGGTTYSYGTTSVGQSPSSMSFSGESLTATSLSLAFSTATAQASAGSLTATTTGM